MNPVKGPVTGAAISSGFFSLTTFLAFSAVFLAALTTGFAFASSSSEDELSLLSESDSEPELDEEEEDDDDEEEEEEEEEEEAGAAAATAALTAFLGVDAISADGGGTAANLPIAKKPTCQQSISTKCSMRVLTFYFGCDLRDLSIFRFILATAVITGRIV